ncbi:hypothetical protein [Micromonospora sp. DT47]|uniref:hypothetical protein n=1 Tax=Micromonospora sp. DT47 TaxID=3393431 RepID=UPI003CE69D2D
MSESGATPREPERTGAGRDVEPDIVLDIPNVSVDSIRLAVDELDADVSLRVRLANLLQLDAGVRVHLAGVELDIEGVQAEALLKVRLDRLVEILDRALNTIDRNPEIIQALARTAGVSLSDVNLMADRLTGATAPVVDEVGREVRQPVASIGAVADQVVGQASTAVPGDLRPESPRTPAAPARPQGVAAPGATRPERPVGPRPESPAGPSPAGSPPEPPLGRSPAAAPGGSTAGEAGTATEGRAGGAAATAGDREASAPRAPDGEPPGGREQGGRSGAGTAREEGGRPPGGGEPGESGEGRGQSAAAQASQLAEQAGETLRQAGRSVWEAIQGGMAQRRQGQQRPDR